MAGSFLAYNYACNLNSIYMHLQNLRWSRKNVNIYWKARIYKENRMNASAFRDIWARVMFLKFSKLYEPQASAICIGNHMISSAIWNK